MEHSYDNNNNNRILRTHIVRGLSYSNLDILFYLIIKQILRSKLSFPFYR